MPSTTRWCCCKSASHFIKVNSKFSSFVQFLVFMYQDTTKFLVDMPTLSLVCFSRCRLSHNLKVKSIQVLHTKIKSRLNISQTTANNELCKAHYQKLISVIELYNMAIIVIPFDVLAKFILRKEKNKLHEDYFAFINSLQELALMQIRKLRVLIKK